MQMKDIDPKALFRLSVLGPLVSRDRLDRGGLRQIIRQLAQQEYAIPGPAGVTSARRRCSPGITPKNKYKTLRRHKRRSEEWLNKMRKAYPRQFVHWQFLGVKVG
jgi:hypothetical protein